MNLAGNARKYRLLFFALLGGLVFLVDAWLREDPRVFDVTPDVRSELEAQLTATLSRPPTEAEIRAAVQRWIDEEVLLREAMALGLSEDDPVIRQHLVHKLSHIVRERTILDPPTETELLAQLQSQTAKYRAPTTFDLTHVFLRGQQGAIDDARVADTLSQLRAGAHPETTGDHFPRGPRLQHMTQHQLEQALGLSLADALHADHLHEWQPLPGRRGVHLIRVDAIIGGEPNIDKVRPLLIADIEEQKKQAALREFLEHARKKYRIDGAATSEE